MDTPVRATRNQNAPFWNLPSIFVKAIPLTLYEIRTRALCAHCLSAPPVLHILMHQRRSSNQLDRIERKLDQLAYGVFKMSAEMDALRTAVTSQRTVVDGVVTMLSDLSERLKRALADDDPAAIQAIVADIESNTKSMADAVLANTPKPTPEEPPAPVDPSADPSADPQPT